MHSANANVMDEWAALAKHQESVPYVATQLRPNNPNVPYSESPTASEKDYGRKLRNWRENINHLDEIFNSFESIYAPP